MKRYLLVFCFVVYIINCASQVYEAPIFDRSDRDSIRIEKVIITEDTTYLYFTCIIEDDWVNISSQTFLEDPETQERFRIIKSEGIPLSPERKDVIGSRIIRAKMCFPHVNIKKINFIENPNDYVFNIYGINLEEKYDSVYSYEDYSQFEKLSYECDSLGDVEKAIEYKLAQQEASNYLCGMRSLPSGCIAYDLCLLYGKLANYEKALYWGELSLSILSVLPAICDVSKDDIARIENSLSADSYYLRDIKKALYYGEKSLASRTEIFGPDHILCCNSLLNLAPVYREIGDYQKAIDYYSRACRIYSNSIGKYHSEYIESSNGLVKSYIQNQQYETALLIAREILSICDSLYTKESIEYIQSLSAITQCYFYTNDMENALRYANEAYYLSVIIDRDNYTKSTINSIINLMRLYNYSMKYDNTIHLGQKHLSLVEYNYGMATTLSEAYEGKKDLKNAIKYRAYAVSLCAEHSTSYYQEMDKLASLYIDKGDFLKSKEIYDYLINLYDRESIQDSVVYANVLSHTSIVYSNMGNRKEALKYCSKSKQVRYNLLNSNAESKSTLFGNYLLSIENLVAELLSDDIDDDVLSLLDEGLVFYEKNSQWIDNKNLFPNLISLKGSFYRHKGSFKKALELFNQALKMQSNLDSLDYESTLLQISRTYKSMEDYETALQYAMKAQKILELVVGNNHPKYADLQKYIASLFFYSGQYHQALVCAQDVANISRKSYGYYSPEYAEVLNNIASFYFAIGDRQKEQKYKKEALQILEHVGLNYGELYSILCRDLSYYSDSTLFYLDKAKKSLILSGNDKGYIMGKVIESEASYYFNVLKDSTKAKNILFEAIKIVKENKGNRSIAYAELIEQLSDFYGSSDLNRCMELNDSAFHIYQMMYDRKSVKYAEKLYAYGVRSFLAHNISDSIVDYMKSASNIISSHFIDASITMPYKEMNNYWYSNYWPIYTLWIPYICNVFNTYESNQLLYNNLLFTKGLLLTADMNIRERVLTSQNDSLISLYREYNDISNSLNVQYSLSPEKRILNVDSLLQLKEDIGWSLSHQLSSDEKGLFHKVTWDDVRNQLNEKDVAVEFGSYVNLEDKLYKNYYYALVLNKKSDCPKLIKLFEKSELDSLMKVEHVDSLKLSNLIWKPIFDEITDARNIYFSPYGLLNLWGIEYLPINNGNTYTFYRLSSTKELCNNTAKKDITNAVLYGGIDYNSKKKNKTNDYGLSTFDERLTRSISSRGSFDPLINSGEEIKQISSILLSKGVNCSLYEADCGTEESLRLLSGKYNDVLHLATHGMFVNSQDAEEIKVKDNLRFVITDDDAEIEDKSLSRSFIVMSGGNMLMHRDSTSYVDDDGILTANEISQIDLHNVDLVVLSACESALGDMSSDGVYGLQRGFKKAGVKTILMSLDKVDDEATKILMVEFYKNLMSGKTKNQSLKDAQKHLRQVNNGKYDKPEYWASFIMLDGLN